MPFDSSLHRKNYQQQNGTLNSVLIFITYKNNFNVKVKNLESKSSALKKNNIKLKIDTSKSASLLVNVKKVVNLKEKKC